MRKHKLLLRPRDRHCIDMVAPERTGSTTQGENMHILPLQLFLLLAAATAASACPFITDDVVKIPKLFPPIGGAVTSGFGIRLHPMLRVTKFHPGIDYEAALGEQIRAAAGGQVVVAERQGAYGDLIVIKHSGGVETAYAHLSRIDARKGDCIGTGTPIGLAGATGLAVGPKLHFEVRQNGQFIDPLSLMQSAKR
jgi:murein DD-endopeptidase MepM/ murein hydrolase activator NlpD